jgi:hypothetical protein
MHVVNEPYLVGVRKMVKTRLGSLLPITDKIDKIEANKLVEE